MYSVISARKKGLGRGQEKKKRTGLGLLEKKKGPGSHAVLAINFKEEGKK